MHRFVVAGMLLSAVACTDGVEPEVSSNALGWSELDGEQHPYVGLALFYDDVGPIWACSGALIAPTVFLTSGGCTAAVEADFDGDGVPESYGPVRARISMRSDLTLGGPYAWGTPHTHPAYDVAQRNPHDLGVVVLDAPVTVARFPSLAPLGSVDALAHGALVDVVGYGLHGPPDFTTDVQRRRAQLRFVNDGNADGSLMKTAETPATGSTCWGDGGGPLLLAGTDAIVAVVSGVGARCVGVGLHYRTDLASSQDFLAGF